MERLLRKAALPVVAAMLAAVGPWTGSSAVSAAGSVAKYVVSPSPIATAATLTTGASVPVTVTAEDSGNLPVAGATVFLSFAATSSGGSAFASGTGLTTTPAPFTADANGQVAIVYHAGSASGGQDIITAANAAAAPTISAIDPYRYSLVTAYTLAPSPIAATASLVAGQQVAVTLTAKNSTGAAVPGATVFLSFLQAVGGGSAVVTGTSNVPLTGSFLGFTANSSGQLLITYTAPTPVPSTGVDTIRAADATRNATVSARDDYNFSQVAQFVMTPLPIAATGTLAAASQVLVRVTALGTSGQPIGGASIYLSYTAGGGGLATVSGVKLTTTPQKFVTTNAGNVTVSYRTPGTTLPKGGTDTITAANAATNPTATMSDNYSYVGQYVFSPGPIAPAATLGANASVPISLTSEDNLGNPAPGVTVYLSFTKASTSSASGGSVSANGTTLTSSATGFNANASGQINLAYTAPASLPTGGQDIITAANQSITTAKLKVTDAYNFSTVTKYGFAPTPIALSGSLGPEVTVPVTLTVRDASNLAVPGATVQLALLPAPAGGSATANGKPLTSTFQPIVASNVGEIAVRYRTPPTLPASGSVDTISAQDALTNVIAQAKDTYTFGTAAVGSIGGTVTDASTSKPVAAVTVTYSGGSTTTDASGAYVLTGVPPGSYFVTASAGGYTSQQSPSVTVTAGATATQNFSLAPLTGAIKGLVSDASSSKPIAGATVSYVVNGVTTSATTDGAGNYILSNVAEGTYTLTASASNYTSSAPVSVTVGAGATVPQNFSLAPLPGSITGQVTDSTTTKAIAATVSYTVNGVTTSATTDSLGNYTLSNVVEGTYSLTASASGYASASKTVVVGPAASVTQNFALVAAPGSIRGTVTDASTAAPIAGATVSFTVNGVLTSTGTDGSGSYTLSNVAPGSYSVTASASGYSSQSQPLTVNPNSATTQNFSLAPLPGTITGTVTDAVTAKPTANATVSYSGGSTTTNAAGVYTLSGVVEGSYAVTASATNYTSSAPVSVAVGPGATPTQNFILAPLPGSISGQVTDAATTSPIAGATVSFTVNGVTTSTTTDSSGNYILSNVVEGTYSLTASAANHGSLSQQVVVGPGAAASQNFALPPAPGTISGTVIDASNSKPVSGATVSYSGGSVSTNASGAYTLSNVPPGSYVLTASAGGYASQQSPAVTVTSNAVSTQNYSLAPQPGSITGTVTDAVTGRAIPNATVSYSGGSTTTNAAGVYTLSGVTEGSYSVTASAANYTSTAPVSVAVGPGATTTQNFSLAPQPGSITGTVIDAVTAKAIAGATVSYSGGSITTNAAGVYTLTGVIEGSYSVTASASNYTSSAQVSVTVGPGATATQNLSLAPVPGSITGTVTDSVTAKAIAGATVSSSAGSTTTNGAGVYTLSPVTEGSYSVTASASGYSSQSQTVAVGPGATALQNFSLAPLAGSITGTVTDAVTAKVIAGATVSYSGGSTTTNAAGVYTLSAVTEGSYSVTASASNYTSSAPVSATVGPGATATQNVSLAPLPGSISGTVTDSVTAKAIVGATVSYSGGSTTTDGSGAYTLNGVTEGSYSVTASASGYSSQSQTVVVGPGASVSQNYALVTAISTQVFSDGFESGTMSAWTTSTGLTVETTTVHSGTRAAEGNTTTGATYARKTLSTTYTNLYYRTYFDLKSEGANTVSLMGLRTAAAGPLVRLYVDTSGRLGMRNEVAATSATGPAVSLGSWHSLEVHVIINGTSSTTEAWLDGTAVSAFGNLAANLGTTPVGMLQLGENSTARTYDVVFDDVVAGTSRIGQ